jgi:membrane-bound serine protease (ClpP class)
LTKIVLLLGLGLVLIIAEILIPSMGVLGIAASLSIIGAVVWAFTFSFALGMKLLGAVAVLVPVSLMLGFKLLPHSPFAKRLMARGFSFKDGRGTDRRIEALMGAAGVVEAPLRPAGTARIDGQRVDVVSRGDMIEAGAEVEVVDVKGNRVVVARRTAAGEA